MSGMIVFRNVSVQGANAIAGLTWGFPAISAFLGAAHRIDRDLHTQFGTRMGLIGGCAVICHDCEHKTIPSNYGTHRFCQSRAPLTKDGKVAPFNEEGKMHIRLTLALEITGSLADLEDKLPDDLVEEYESEQLAVLAILSEKLAAMRLAGGIVTGVGSVEYVSATDTTSDSRLRRSLLRCLPGYALVDRSELLQEQLQYMDKLGSGSSALDAWMQFSSIRHRSSRIDADSPVEWDRIPLVERGWFVPIAKGFQEICESDTESTRLHARSNEYPFKLVESLYGIGQWISPHRVPDWESLLWRYKVDGTGQYIFANTFAQSNINEEEK